MGRVGLVCGWKPQLLLGTCPVDDAVVEVVFFECEDDGVRVFAVDGFPGHAVDHLGACVVAELDAVVDFLVVHDVGFEEDDRALVDSVS